jgi:WD40 repeat protein
MVQENNFPSLPALREVHKQLLTQRREEVNETYLADVELFIQRGCATGVLLDQDDDRWDVQNLLDFWANELLHNKRIAPDATLVEYDPTLAPEIPDDLCPYIGLDAFASSQKAFFFGRTQLVQEMIGRLENGRFLAIVGSSGSGKSSIALAGLLSRLQAGQLPNSQNWHYFPPIVPSAAPLENLARIIQPNEKITPDLINQYVDNPQTLVIQLQQYPQSMLLIDQFEEIYTLCYDQAHRRALIKNILAVLQQPDNLHTIVMTMRSDLETHLVRIPDFQKIFTNNQIRLSPMDAADLREVIENPAELVGLRFEDGLIDELIRDVLGEPSALPLLQFTLLKLWESREKNRITWDAYRRLGGGRSALANSADMLYNELPTNERPIARQLLLRLVRFGQGLEVSRDRVLQQQLIHSLSDETAVIHVLNQFIHARLIRQTSGTTAENNTVELAHEALLTHWPQFIGWLEEERVAQRNRLQLASMAAQWSALQQDESVLLRGRLLEDARSYNNLSEVEQAFISASEQKAHREELEKERDRRARLNQAVALAEERQKRLGEKERLTQRLSRALIALLVVAVFAVIAGSLAMRSADNAEQSAATAVASEATALANKSVADALRSTAVYNVAQLATAETDALQERDLAAQNEHLAQQARATAEASFVIANEARATAEVSAVEAQTQFRVATARELAAAAVDQLNNNPQLSLYLAIESVYFPLAVGQSPPGESADVLYRALQASQFQLTYSGHTDWISDIAVSPDGEQIATAGYDGTVRIWDRATGQEQRILSKHSGVVNSVAFNHSGTQIASGGNDGYVYIWRTSDFELVASLPDEENGHVKAIAFHPDNILIAAAYNDSSVRLWNIPAKQSQVRLFGHLSAINDVAFNATGDRFVTAGEDGLTIVRDTATGTNLYSLANPQGTIPVGVNAVAFSPDGTRIVTANDDGIARIWQDQLVMNTLPGHTSFIFDVAYSSDGSMIATASGDGTARIWQASNGQVVSSITGHTGGVTAVQFTPNGLQLLTASQDNSARLWNTTPGIAPLVLSGHTAPIRGVAYSPDGALIATGSEDRTAVIWDADNGLAIQTFAGHNRTVNDVTFSPDGRTLATASEDANVRLWQLDSGVALFLPHIEAVNTLAYYPDGSLLASGSDDGRVRIWELGTNQIVQRFRHDTAVLDVAFHPNGQLLLASDESGQVWLWDRETEAVQVSYTGHSGPVQAVAISPDGTLVATAGNGGAARIWTLDGTLLRTISGHNSAVLGIAFNPDGTQLATTGADRAVRLWNVATGQSLYSISGQTAAVTAVTFSPDGTHIVTASIDRTAQINGLRSIADLFTQAWLQLETPIDSALCQQYLHGEPCITQAIDQSVPPLNLPTTP